MAYKKTTDVVYDYDKVYFVQYKDSVYRLLSSKKTLQGYMFYCDGTFYDLCTINYDTMNVSYKGETLDILEYAEDSGDVPAGAFVFRGSVDSYDDLPADATNGDVYQVGDKEYAWNGTEWVLLGFNMDLSDYATIANITTDINLGHLEEQNVVHFIPLNDSDTYTGIADYVIKNKTYLSTGINRFYETGTFSDAPVSGEHTLWGTVDIISKSENYIYAYITCVDITGKSWIKYVNNNTTEKWHRLDNTVDSINGKTGAVEITAEDISAAPANFSPAYVISLVEDTTSENGITYSSNKTFEEIKDAYTSGKVLCVNTDSVMLTLQSVQSDANAVRFSFGYTSMMSDGDNVTTYAISYLHTYAVNDEPASDSWTGTQHTEQYLKTSGGTLTGDLSMGANSILDVQKLHIDGQAPFYLGQVIDRATPNKPRLTGVVNSNAAAFVRSDSQSEYVPLFVGTPSDNNHAATKKFVDDSVSTKLTRVTDVGNDDRVYGVLADGTAKMFPASSEITASAVVMRDATGAINIHEPTEDTHPATKHYVDSLIGDINEALAALVEVTV